MKMLSRHDFHVHTNLSACAEAGMTLSAVLRRCEELGVREVGIADHVNHPDDVARNAALLEEIRRTAGAVEVSLGAEDNYLPEFGGHSLTLELRERHGYRYVIGSHHNLYLSDRRRIEPLVEEQHRHHLLTCRHPAMDVLGHPFRYLKGLLDAFGLPASDLTRVMGEPLVRELGRVAKETGTAVEINALSFLAGRPWSDPLVEGYLALLATLAGEGVLFALGSDAHRPSGLDAIALAWQAAARLGLGPDRLWRPDRPPPSAAVPR